VRILYGAADGFLRMVRNDTGVESWAFMPQAVMGQQKTLRDNQPGARFPYGVDGEATIAMRDRGPNGGPADGVINGAGDDAVWAFFGLRRSGAALYALNLTNPDLPTRIAKGAHLAENVNVPQSWYLPGEAGYIDYPTLEEEAAASA